MLTQSSPLVCKPGGPPASSSSAQSLLGCRGPPRRAAQRSAGVRGEINGEIWPPSERRHREGKRAWHFDSGSAAVEDGKPRSELMLPMLQLLFDSHELFRHKIPVLYPLLLVV